MSQTNPGQLNSEADGGYVNPRHLYGDGFGAQAQGYDGTTGVPGLVQSPTQPHWSFSARQGDASFYGQFSQEPKGSSAVDGGFYPDLVDNDQLDVGEQTTHPEGSTSIPGQAGHPEHLATSGVFLPLAPPTSQPFGQILPRPTIGQPQSIGNATLSVTQPPVAVTPERVNPRRTPHRWTPEQLSLLWSWKTSSDPTKRRALAIATEILMRYNVEVTANMVTKKWAKLKKQRIEDNVNVSRTYIDCLLPLEQS